MVLNLYNHLMAIKAKVEKDLRSLFGRLQNAYQEAKRAVASLSIDGRDAALAIEYGGAALLCLLAPLLPFNSINVI